jgi:SH3 domain protein
MMKTSNLSIWVCLILCAPIAHGAPAWVTDEFEITLRSGPSTSNAIQLMVGSGMQLEVLEGDAESGYSRVRTPGGTEGWVLTRYLVNEAGAREQLETLTSQLTNANTRGTSLDSQLAVVINDHDSANERIAVLETENSSLESELAEIKRTAANVLGVNEQNSQLNDNLATAEIRADTLEQENRQLSSRTTRYWFMSGALVLLVGIILGIWLPRIRWQRRSGYDRF